MKTNNLIPCYVSLVLLLSSLTCHATGLENFNVRQWDYDSDGDIDFLVSSGSEKVDIAIPYDIQVSVEIPKEGEYFLLEAQNGNSAYQLIPSPAVDVSNANWLPSVYMTADFNADNFADFLILPPQMNTSGVMLLGIAGQPVLQQVFSQSDIGLDLAASDITAEIKVNTYHIPAKDYVLIDHAGSGRWASFVNENNQLTRVVRFPLQYVDGELDTDGDGIVDTVDVFYLDAALSLDTDFDGIADALDNDIDGDGIANNVDAYATDKNNGEAVGALPGSFSVSANGKVIYDIPLEAPPSAGNVLPPLSLSYNHGAGNGPLGVGWSLSGLSEITRCANTLAQDGYVNGVNYDSSDRFCLNGQRLVLISGNYGASGSEYRTESDIFAKITAHGTGTNGPLYFLVQRVGGEKEWYGTSADGVPNSASRRRSGSNATASWAIGERQDRQGNSVQFDYVNNSGTGEFYIDEIRYGAGSDLDNRIDFVYANRTDWHNQYIDNTLSSYRKRLTHVKSYLGKDGNAVRDYTLNYEYSPGLNRSRITSIEVCAYKGSKQCLKTSSFTWENPAANDFAFVDSGDESETASGDFIQQQYNLGDVTGDGRADLLWTYQVNNTNTLAWQLFQASGTVTDFTGFDKVISGSDTDTGLNVSMLASGSSSFLSGDVNGDGFQDMVYSAVHQGVLYRVIYVWDPVNNEFDQLGYESDSDVTHYNNATDNQFILADINGDQRSDLLWVFRDAVNHQIRASVYLAMDSSDGIGGLSLAKVSSSVIADGADGYTPQYYGNQQFLIGDVNGDSKSDLVWVFSINQVFYRALYLANASGSGFDAISFCGHADCAAGNSGNTSSASPADSEHRFLLGDINADNKADLIWTYQDNGSGGNGELAWKIFQSDQNGSNFKLTSAATADNTNNHEQRKLQLADINGDDRLDLIYTYVNGGIMHWSSYLATGTSTPNFSAHASGAGNVTQPIGASYHDYQFADFSGDGKADFVYAYYASSHYRTWMTQPHSYPDHIAYIDNGLGKTYDIDYAYLSNSDEGFYTKGAAVSYPLRNDNGLSYLVQSVEQSNGIGGTNRFDYSYVAGRTDLHGRGFLGFEEQALIDQARGVKTSSSFVQSFPFTGLLSHQSLSTVNGSGDILQTFEDNYYHWAATETTTANQDTYYFRYLVDQGVVRRSINSGGAVHASVILYGAYDAYGNLETQTTTVGQTLDSSKIANFDPLDSNNYFATSDIANLQQAIAVVNAYNNNTANWRIGFKTSEQTTYSAPSTANKSVTHTYTPKNSTGFLVGTERNFDGSGVWQQKVYQHDSYGNIKSTTTTAGARTSGSSIESIDNFTLGLYPDHKNMPEGLDESYEYDPYTGELSKLIDANKQVTHHYYNGFGRKTLSVANDGTRTAFDYAYCGSCPADAVYKVTQTVSHASAAQAGAPQSIQYFDAFDRLIAEQTEGFSSGDSIWVQNSYDALGRRVTQSQPHLGGSTPPSSYHAVTYAYDVLDRLISENRPDGGNTTTTYSSGSFGEQHTVSQFVSNPDGPDKTVSTVLHKNALGHLRRSIDHEGTVTDFWYDAQGELRQVQVNNDASTTVTVETDVAGNRTRIVDPDVGEVIYSYDGMGNMLTQTWVNGAGNNHYYTNKYDDLGRKTQQTLYNGSGTEIRTWEWDSSFHGKGKLGRIYNNEGGYNEEFYYDVKGRLEHRVVGIDGFEASVFSHAYDHYSRQTGIRYPDSFELTTVYNNRGYREQIKDSNTNTLYWQANAQDAYGNYTDIDFGNGLQSAWVFAPASGRVTSIQTGSTLDTGSVQDQTYLHDSAGNLVRRESKAVRDLTEQFTYDNLHRLRTSRTSGLLSGARALEYHYDALGNLKDKTDISDTNGYHYGEGSHGAHAVSRVTLAGSDTAYDYDFKGNMTARGDDVLAYAVFNKPARIANSSDPENVTKEILFTYGPDWQRIAQTANVNGQITNTFYYGDGYEVVVEGNVIRAKTTVDDFLLHQLVVNKTDNTRAEELKYLHHDHLGSLDAITDNAGNPTYMAFDPFGLRRQGDWENADSSYKANLASLTFANTTQGYTGHEQIDSLELIHMNGRVYDPVIGRFVTPDLHVQFPENGQSYNRYSYVMNNPVSYTDPSGEFIPLVIYGAVLAYRAYSAYDTVMTASQDVQVLMDKTASTQDKVIAGLSLAASVTTGKAGRSTIGVIAKKAESKGPKGKPELADSKGSSQGTGSDKATEAGEGSKARVEKGEDGRAAGESVTNSGQAFQRVMSNAELMATKETGLLRGGRSGENFFTNNASLDAKRAQQRLGLDGPLRDSRVEFKIKNDVQISGPRSAKPGQTGTLGGGREFSTNGRTEIEILSVDPLRK